MTNQDLVSKQLPTDLVQLAMAFDIPDEFLESEPELIIMVLKSRSIDTTQEKQNRFNLLPLMNDVQMEKLRWILLKEKNKLKEIEDKYSKKKEEIEKKYLTPQDPRAKQKAQQIKQKESKVAEAEAEQAEDLLDMI